MGKIKVFQATNPNTNVSFSRIPNQSSAGVVDQTVSSVANNFERQATKYLEDKRKQKDTTDVLSAENNRVDFITKLRGATLDQSTGTYDLETFNKELDLHNTEVKGSLSSAAWGVYSRKNSVQDTILKNKVFYENMGQERKNNRSTLERDLGAVYEKMGSSSFEDMSELNLLLKLQ